MVVVMFKVGDKVKVYNVQEAGVSTRVIEGDTGIITGRFNSNDNTKAWFVKCDNPIGDSSDGIWAFMENDLEHDVLPKGSVLQ